MKHILIALLIFNYVLVWSQDSTIEVLVSEGMPTSVYSMACSYNGEIIAAGGEKIIKLFDFETGVDLFTVFIDDASHITHITFSPDDQVVAFYSLMKIYILDLKQRKIITSFNGAPPFVFSSTNKYFTFCHPVNVFKNQTSSSEVFSALVTGASQYIDPKNRASDNRVIIYKTTEWKLFAQTPVSTCYIESMILAPNDNFIVLALIDTSGYEPEPLILKVEDIVNKFEGKKGVVNFFKFSSNFKAGAFTHMEFSNYGNFIMLSNNEKIIIWDLLKKEIVYEENFSATPHHYKSILPRSIFADAPNEIFLFETARTNSKKNNRKVSKLNFLNKKVINQFIQPLRSSFEVLNKK